MLGLVLVYPETDLEIHGVGFLPHCQRLCPGDICIKEHQGWHEREEKMTKSKKDI